ncbi:MAG: WG repeat-containing protein [Candidatus Sulfopaludibacter sp.]|nr:WG repeat-containing protein [Candidatus Sulfopaludibacter sp.]
MRIVLKIGAALFLLAAFSFSTSVEIIPIKQKGAGPLFQIHRGRKWGYMDRTGKVVVRPQFDWEQDYFDGLAGVSQGQKWGYADEPGEIVIPIQFDGAGHFSDGLAPVLVGRRWAYIDLAGRFVVVPRFQGAAEFHEGVARVVTWDTARCDNRSYTNEDAPAFVLNSSGFGCEYTNRRFGFISRGGEFLVAPQYSDAEDFSEGLANIRTDDSDGPRWGFIDRTGKAVIPPRFTAVLPFSEGLAAVRVDTTGGL